MAATKTAKTLLTSQSLAASTPVNITEWNMSTCYGGGLCVKLTNGTAPTTAPIVEVYVGESTGTKRLYYTGVGGLVTSGNTHIVVDLPAWVMFANATITWGATYGGTVEAYGQEFTTG